MRGLDPISLIYSVVRWSKACCRWGPRPKLPKQPCLIIAVYLHGLQELGQLQCRPECRYPGLHLGRSVAPHLTLELARLVAVKLVAVRERVSKAELPPALLPALLPVALLPLALSLPLHLPELALNSLSMDVAFP